MQLNQGQNNAQTLFGINAIPTDNHIRTMLDQTKPESVFPVFDKIGAIWSEKGLMKEYQSIERSYLVAIDGTEYFHSESINCSGCQKKEYPESIHYSHSALTPIIVRPGHNQVLTLRPEFITPQDGQEKQDCEINAAKRWLSRFGEHYDWKATILGDDLYAHHPFCDAVLKAKQHFILVCKESSHPTLYEFVEYLEKIDQIQSQQTKVWTTKGWEERKYRYVNGIPLRDGDDSLMVNWCEVIITGKGKKKTYRNTFITDYLITQENVDEICQGGRARWKAENENNNTLKTKGYHLEHNFGHGKQHLSALLATLNMLAFALHTLLEMVDHQYLQLRERLPSRATLFEHIRTLISYICFRDWNHLMIFMIQGLDKPHELSLQDSS